MLRVDRTPKIKWNYLEAIHVEFCRVDLRLREKKIEFNVRRLQKFDFLF